MKHLLLLVLFSSALLSEAQQVTSKVYSWDQTEADGKKRKTFFSGEATDLKSVELSAVMLTPGQVLGSKALGKANRERLFLVKDGQVNITIEGQSKVVGPGSVALVLPGDDFAMENTSDAQSAVYIMEYQSREAVNAMRGDTSGGSFIIDFEDLEFRPHDKGGIRNYFNRATAMCQYFEMHVTTLNGGIKSHEPHTHRAAEIVLMINGNTEMQIADDFYQGTTGDIYYLGSNVSHAIQNVGKEPCMYFAFQWQ